MPAWELNQAVRTIADGISSIFITIPSAGIGRACRVLNEQRHFDLTRQIGAAWVGSARDFNASIVNYYIQALIELSQLKEAEQALEQACGVIEQAEDRRTFEVDYAKYKGLWGRIYKQRYVNDEDNAALLAAFAAYYTVYLENPDVNYWQGVNALALLARAGREGVTVSEQVTTTTLARDLWNRLHDRHMDDAWVLPTLSEICLALGQEDQAELWLFRLLYAQKCTPFMLESYSRQLREIWGARPYDGSTRIQDRLASLIARHQMTRMSLLSLPLPVSAEARLELERNFTGAGAFSVETLQQILKVCASIGCVCSLQGVRLGSGFLIDAAALGLSGDQVFVTNAHVLSDTVAGAIRQADALVTFELTYPVDGKPVFHKISEILFSSSPGPLGAPCEEPNFLDVTVARLETLPPHGTGLSISPTLPIADGRTRAYVIGHPRGSGLQISIHDSELLDVDDVKRLLHYRTPTDPGSSGSPVFNEGWRLIALHHGGSSKMPRFRPVGSIYEANEGISIQAIRAGIRHAQSVIQV